MTATVSIPRSFVVGVYKAKHPDTPEPQDNDAEFVAVRNEQIDRVAKTVERIVMAKELKDVEVDVYPDMDWSPDGGMWSRAPGQAAAVQDGAEFLDAIGMLQTYGPQVGLSVLALISFVMMMRVVGKSSEVMGKRKPVGFEAKADLEHEPILSAGAKAVGQAELSESVLTAKEVDEATVRFDELGEEVSKMVEDDPEGAANLIRRWMEAD